MGSRKRSFYMEHMGCFYSRGGRGLPPKLHRTPPEMPVGTLDIRLHARSRACALGYAPRLARLPYLAFPPAAGRTHAVKSYLGERRCALQCSCSMANAMM